MKTKLCILITGILLVNTFASSQVYTPKGSLVTDTEINPEQLTSSDIAYIMQYMANSYPNAVIIGNPTTTYNCHAYAWHISEGGIPLVWMGLSTNPTPIYWNDGSYFETTERGDGLKVSYANPPYGTGSDNHSAITTSEIGIFISKWGAYPLVKHAKDYSPYTYSSLHYFKKNTLSPTITGPGLVCPCGTTFTINNLPPNAVVTWSQSATLLQIGGSNGTMTFRSNGNGEGWISAKVNGNSLPQLKVWGGTPNTSTREIGIVFSTNPDSKNICINKETTLGVISTQVTNDYVTGYEWDFGYWSQYLTGYLPGSGSTASQSNAYANINLDKYAQSMQIITVNPLNPCSIPDELPLYNPPGGAYHAVICPGVYSIAYPNPANDLLNIEISEDEVTSKSSQPSFAPVITNIETTGAPLLIADEKQNKVTDPVFDIRLYNEMGVQVRHTTATKGGKVEFNVSNLPNGNYYLHIYDGINDKPEMKQIIIKH